MDPFEVTSGRVCTFVQIYAYIYLRLKAACRHPRTCFVVIREQSHLHSFFVDIDSERKEESLGEIFLKTSSMPFSKVNRELLEERDFF